tara:strand:+ start:31 stop:231 length:201 start_codon:yes stop_codon:yes gene_type:complete
MLQQISKWIWGSTIEYNNSNLGKRYAACKIENAYLEYMSKKRIENIQKEKIKYVVSNIRKKNPLKI